MGQWMAVWAAIDAVRKLTASYAFRADYQYIHSYYAGDNR